MPFDDLRAFLVVAEHGSFLSAAVALGVSRTTLRRQVEALEARAGVPLLQRLRKGILLTDAGRRLATSGRSFEEQLNAMLRSVRDTGAHPEGEVRCLVPIGLPPLFVAAVYRVFSINWPKLRVQVEVSAAPLAADLSGIDVLVWFGREQPPPNWICNTVVNAPLRLFASKEYLEEHGTPTTARELATHPILAWLAPGESKPHLTTRSGARRAFAPEFVTTDIHLLHELARANLGIAWAPDGDLPLPDGSAFIGVLEDLYAGSTELRLAVPAALVDVPKVRVFLESLDLIRQTVRGTDT